MDVNEIIAIISRRQSRLQDQRMDETARLMDEEYDALLAEIRRGLASEPEVQRKNKEAEAQILGDQGQSGG